MPADPPRHVALVAAEGTLEGVAALLKRHHVRVVRLESVRPVARPPREWLSPTVRRMQADLVLATSRAGVESGVGPWWARRRPGTGRPEAWAVGGETAAALRQLGFDRVRVPARPGTTGLPRAIGRLPLRRILYFRSDRAGPSLAVRLRREGHRVREVVSYRLRAAPGSAGPARRAVARADLVVVTSPSGLHALKRRLGPRAWKLASTTRNWVVLGENSRATGRRLGISRLRIIPPGTAQRFTRDLLRELSDAQA